MIIYRKMGKEIIHFLNFFICKKANDFSILETASKTLIFFIFKNLSFFLLSPVMFILPFLVML
jgi:hypothetical protein